MERIPYGKHTKEFRVEAVKLEAVGKNHRQLSDRELKLHRLKRELAETPANPNGLPERHGGHHC
ncbi:MAG: hypothetical protein ISR96_03885 [Nitrospira sp.]|nr:hypothetical protein [bacterium]MBL7048653.1 hypothetical protein [Nitrospira sp.]